MGASGKLEMNVECSRFFRIPLCAVLLMAASSALPCGENLFIIGEGRPELSIKVPLAGHILVVARAKGARELAELLSAAGHDVYVVSSVDEVGPALRERGFDIVLAIFSDHKMLEAQMVASKATFLPVADAEERAEARELYRRVLAPNYTLKRFLRTIHRALSEAKV
jgi:hypothetical protein